MSAYERELIQRALKNSNWVQTRAAEQLGTTRRILRYREGGDTALTLSGEVNNEPQQFEYDDVTFQRDGGEEFIARLWATRKIGYLLQQIRLPSLIGTGVPVPGIRWQTGHLHIHRHPTRASISRPRQRM